MDNEIKLVQKYLLQERDRKIKKSLGIGKQEIITQFQNDLFCLPHSGGSDERDLAYQWLERSVGLFDGIESWKKLRGVFSEFYNPNGSQIEELARTIRSRSPSRER